MEGFLMMRYILLMMGFFAMFNGLIYNEFFALPLQVFGDSCYENEVTVLSVGNTTFINADHTETLNKFGFAKIPAPATDPNFICIYPFGIDHKWGLSDQLLTYTNNFKMKLAVIFAIIQMSIGILLKGLNNLHFKDRLGFFTEFVPQIILLLALFGWMDVLIIAKWL